jgi:hypothetical protein
LAISKELPQEETMVMNRWQFLLQKVLLLVLQNVWRRQRQWVLLWKPINQQFFLKMWVLPCLIDFSFLGLSSHIFVLQSLMQKFLSLGAECVGFQEAA